MSSHDSDGEFITRTGWRMPSALANQLGPRGTPLHLLDEAFWGGTFRVHSRVKAPADELVTESLATWLSDVNDADVKLNDDLVLEPGDTRGLYWSPSERGGRLLARHPHPSFARQACVTQLELRTIAGTTTLRIRIGPEDGPAAIRGAVGVGRLAPSWLTELMDRAHFMYDGGSSRPINLDDHAIPGFVERTVLDPSRAFPVAVLSPLEGGGYLVDPSELARELLGVAHLRMIPRHQDTFVLSDSIGDRHLSAFWGALRIFLPGFSRSDHPHTHPLLLPDQLTDPLIRAKEFGSVLLARETLGVEVDPPRGWVEAREAAERERAREAKEAAARREAERARLAASAATAPDVDAPDDAGAETSAGNASPAEASTMPEVASPSPSLALPVDEITGTVASRITEQLSELLARQHALLEELRDEVHTQREKLGTVEGSVRTVHEELEQMRTRMEMGGSDVDHISRQLDRATSLIRRLLPPEDDVDLTEGAQSAEQGGSHELLDVVRTARERYPDDLFILDSAEATARESDFHDPSIVELILGVMADVSRQRQEGQLGRGLKIAFRDYGLNYASGIAKTTPERIRKQHQFTDEHGVTHACEEHISVGNSYDSRYCLRVYFTSRSTDEPRFVIGHVGQHLETMSTS